MKKSITVLALFVFVLQTSGLLSQEIFHSPKGGYKVCTAYIYPYIIGINIPGVKQQIFQMKYDDKGHIVEVNTSGTESKGTKQIFKYDSKGYLIKTQTFDLDGKSLKTVVQKNDDNGNVLEIIESGPSGKIIKNGVCKTEESSTKANGAIVPKSNCKYNSKSQLIEKLEYDKDGLLSKKHIYKYDKFGNQIEDIIYNKSNKAEAKIKYEYKK